MLPLQLRRPALDRPLSSGELPPLLLELMALEGDLDLLLVVLGAVLGEQLNDRRQAHGEGGRGSSEGLDQRRGLRRLGGLRRL
ncbi:hypothetical protein WMF26_31095 [Sorangium sp. So ce185]|uniref:hypothetical protein n=1 Tax=Sorangium sp. So ce185 TaxID=3133287 RepID=UPI003F5EB809